MPKDKEQKKSKRGGARKGAGRPKKTDQAKKLTTFQVAMEKVGNYLPDAIDFLGKGLKDPDKKFAKSCADSLLKKGLPDHIQTETNTTVEIIDSTEL